MHALLGVGSNSPTLQRSRTSNTLNLLIEGEQRIDGILNSSWLGYMVGWSWRTGDLPDAYKKQLPALIDHQCSS